jgi:nucleotide-binding universal stress UspA family protein
MINRSVLIVCTDFSLESDQALKMAGALRRKTSCEVLLLHLAPLPMDWDWGLSELSPFYLGVNYQLDYENRLKSLLHEQQARCEVECRARFETGRSVSFLNEIIQQEKAQLILTGHKGGQKTGLHLGGFAEKVVAMATVPVMVVKQSKEPHMVSGLIDPLHLPEKIINTAEEISNLFSSKLEFISIWHNHRLEGSELFQGEDVLARIENLIKQKVSPQVQCELRVEELKSRRIAQQLLQLLHESRSDLVVMEKHHKKRLEHFLVGSETRRMIEMFPGNCLILPELRSS